MLYKFSLMGRGSEFTIGSIQDDDWNYIKEHFGGDADAYNEALENNKIPREHCIYYPDAIYECDDLCHMDGCIPSWFRLEVTDENDNIVCTINDITEVEVEKNTEVIDDKCKHIVTHSNVSKGEYLKGEIDIDGEFDPKKIKFIIDRVEYVNGNFANESIQAIYYDDEDIMAEFECTTGKGDFTLFIDLDSFYDMINYTNKK